jgi:ribosome biogenesis protein SSF1/2
MCVDTKKAVSLQKRKKRSRGAQRDEEKNPPPKSFVFAFGKHRSLLKDLQKDVRNVMQPFTAERMRVSRNNVMKDFVHIAGPLGVTHMVVLTGTERASYLRLCKSPRVRTPSLHAFMFEY